MFVPMLPPTQAASLRAVPVKVVGSQGSYQLMREGKPFFVRGAGGATKTDLLPKYGGNAIRTWGHDSAREDLERCRKAGVMLQMGIWLPHAGEGRDYGDPAVIEDLKGRVRQAVEFGKDHPNLLSYGLGNEMETGGREADPKLWKTVGLLANYLKELDPNHPVVTVVADFSPEKIAAIEAFAPGVDILGTNSYGGAPSVPARLKAAGWTKPYLLTEFGPRGPWEGGKTPWGAALEATSTEKAGHYAESYQKGVLGAKGDCLGSFAFLWGDKQEETATWFGMFLPGTDEPVETVETMSALWTGKAVPKGRLASFGLPKPVYVPGETIVPLVQPNGNSPMRLTFLIRGETATKAFAGQGETTRPVLLTKELPSASGTRTVEMVAPKEPGAYRVYVVARDGSGFAATANAPFQVK